MDKRVLVAPFKKNDDFLLRNLADILAEIYQENQNACDVTTTMQKEKNEYEKR